MIYSVYRPESRRYDYYETPEKTAKNPEADFLLSRGQVRGLGIASTQAGWRLPGNARKVGSGQEPKGMIAVEGSGLPLGGFEMPGGLAGWAALGLGAWWLLSRKRGRR